MLTTFGRFTDAYKPKAKLDKWNSCEKLFEEKKYIESYTDFLEYMKDEDTGNVVYMPVNGGLNFYFFQGSKEIHGTMDSSHVTAECWVAAYDKLTIPAMRRLMEMNYTLYYSRFAIKDNHIIIKFDSGTNDGSPRKLYFAFKEVALRADKQDDLLVDDFSSLKPIDVHGEQLSESEKQLKLKYFREWIGDTLKHIGELNSEQFSGAISYLLLSLLYRIDYLLTPEGILMNDIEKISWTYFTRDNKPFSEKNEAMKKSFEELLAKPDEKILKDLYRTISTFGVANPAGHQAVIDVFNSNLNNVKWYIENNHEDLALRIYEYAAGHCLFSYGLAKPTRQMFAIVMQILNEDFYTELGITEKYYDAGKKEFNKELIINRINEIVKEGSEQFPELKVITENIKFDTLPNFMRTFFTEIHNLNYNV
jgi:hypothetical protein